MKKIFISYSDDSPGHSENVLALSNRLRNDGIDCQVDQYENSPAEGWPKWIDRQLEECDGVLVICTEKYWRQALGEGEQHQARGVEWQSMLLYNILNSTQARSPKVIPVIFAQEDAEYIPNPLKGYGFCCLDNEKAYRDLYRHILNGPAVIKPPLGTEKKLPPERISLSRLPMSGEFFLGRKKELEVLTNAWEEPGTNVIALVAWGGVGKSALVNHWLNLMQQQDYCGADSVYGWSFYSQGASEGSQISADEFFFHTLSWFGDPDPDAGSPLEKGRRLASLIRAGRTLLILDGIEPLQNPPGHIHGYVGRFKDPGLRVLLRELAADQPGLCVLTSREPIKDLGDKKNYSYQEKHLEDLTVEAGRMLLKRHGVKGSNTNLETAVREYGGHALALTLLANYVVKAFEEDIRKRDRIPALGTEPSRGKHAQRVMKAYEVFLKDHPGLNVLYVLGLFDRPVGMQVVEALIIKPFIPGVSIRATGFSEAEWGFILSDLREAGLLTVSNVDKTENEPIKIDKVLDCHPLIREYFGQRFQELSTEGWREAHQQLYKYYKDLPQKSLPDTLEEMEPLYAAINHGCRAELHQEVFDEIFWKRVRRGNKAYTVHKLGAFGAELSALSFFFREPWTHPVEGLKETDKAVTLNWVGFALRALGRLQEAKQPMIKSAEICIKQNDWINAAAATSNISELLLMLGRVTESVDYARKGISYSDKSRDKFWMMELRTALAGALHQAGQHKEANLWFCEAELLQRDRKSYYPYLHSLPGFRYNDFLLAQGNSQIVKERSEQILRSLSPNSRLLDIGFYNLSLGHSLLLENNFDKALVHLNLAVESLRAAGYQYYLVVGLITRETCYRHKELIKDAITDLQEAEEIARMGGMKLYLVDCHLEWGRLHRAIGKPEESNRHFGEAQKLIRETGYKRREKEVEHEIASRR